MLASFALEITHSRSVPTGSHVHCVEVTSTIFSCASQGKRDLDQTGSAPQNEKEDRKTDHCSHAESASHVTRGAGLALYPIQQAKVCESEKNVTIFCDGGSNTTYITHQAADRIKAKKVNRFTLDVTTMGNVEKTYNTRHYQFTLRTDTGKRGIITPFGMDRITGPVSKLDTKVLADLFPGYDVDSLQRRTDKVDVLLWL